MKKVAIIGGGLSGLSTAIWLAKAGVRVELFEASPKLGGRTYSFLDDQSGDLVDNGQHILMGCYKETLQLLKIVNADKDLFSQEKLEIDFIHKDLGIVPLESKSRIYPFNLLIGFLKYKAISLPERLKIIKVLFKLLFVPSDSLQNITVFDWLISEGQNENTIKSFWEILVIGALNTKAENASAKIFADVLKQMFFGGNKSSAIILPKTDLSSLFCNKISSYLLNQNGIINLSSKVCSVKIKRNKIQYIQTDDGCYNYFDFVVSAIPYYAFQKIFQNINELEEYNFQLQYSPIINAHLWLKNNNFKKKFYGFIDSPIHWLFNHGKYITIVKSNAEEIINLTNEEIIRIFTNEIKKYFKDFNISLISHYKIIKEKRATFIPSEFILNNRPYSRTKIRNLFLAGDWTNTHLPATIEGAVKSGRLAADLILNEI
jgi:hydroxysqualene dehydroxylase